MQVLFIRSVPYRNWASMSIRSRKLGFLFIWKTDRGIEKDRAAFGVNKYKGYRLGCKSCAPPHSTKTHLHTDILTFVMAVSSASMISSTPQPLFAIRSNSSCSSATSISNANNFLSAPLRGFLSRKGRAVDIIVKVSAAAAVATPAVEEEVKEYPLPTWADFDLGRAPVFWKTMNGLPPTSGEKLTIFYNPAAKKLAPNEEFGIAFNGGFNQPIMCGGEPRKMLKKVRGKADPPIFTIKIVIPKHAVNLIFSFTNGEEWDGPYKLQFQVAKGWKNKPIEFFNEGLTEELSREGACEQAIFPDTEVVITRCTIMGNLSSEGGDRCNLDFVEGCTDPNSPEFNPLANVDDGSCPPYSDSEE